MTRESKGWGGTLADLVEKYHIDGVILLAANENFYNYSKVPLPLQIAALTNELQSLSRRTTRADREWLPLLIAADHEGDGWPYTRFRNGLTPLPSNMAINATWREQNAEDVGRIVGKEMRALGINLLLGPVVDVLEKPYPHGKGDMGTRLMGSDPYFVGRLGRAFVRGVHQGSFMNEHSTVAVIAKHLPGHGASDRLPDYDVGTISKDLSELRDFELLPFFDVTKLNS